MNFKEYLRSGQGATDITPLLADKEAFNVLIQKLAAKSSGQQVDKVVCVEGRGFLLGAAVAFHLKVGLVSLRVHGKLKNETYSEAFIDYSGNGKILEIHTDAIQQGERILIIDDWIETGATMKAAISLVEKCGGQIVGITAFMDDTTDELKQFLQQYNYQFLEQISAEDTF